MLAFLSPLVLFALLLLPAIWWLLRLLPPQPKRVRFPAIEFLRGLLPERKETAHTPLWLLILRMLLLASVIFALADPVMNRDPPLPGKVGPVLLVVDNGWEAAVNWDVRQKAMTRIARQAAQDGRALYLLPTAPGEDGGPMHVSDAIRPSEAETAVARIKPMPWEKDYRRVVAEALVKTDLPANPGILWLSDGFKDNGGQGVLDNLIGRLRAAGRLSVVTDDRINTPFTVTSKGDFSFTVSGSAPVTLLAETQDGRILSEKAVPLGSGKKEAEVIFDILPEMRAQVSRVFVREKPQASATWLMDGGRWRPVGILAEEGSEKNEGYLSDAFYLSRALEPFSEVASGDLDAVLAKSRAVIIWPDSYIPSTAERGKLENWVNDGGHLVRFAGPNLGRAEAGAEKALLPVDLRAGGRNLEGTLVWSVPQKIAALGSESPLYGLEAPDDVTVSQQVLAAPSPELDKAVIARLEDGTPLVTSAPSGKGRITLVHTTAGPEWSNISLSGFYVGMLRRFIEMGPALLMSSENPRAEMKPRRVMDGFGRLMAPSSGVRPIRGGAFAEARPSPETPPGFYGEAGAEKALNLSDHIFFYERIGAFPEGVDVLPYAASEEIKYKPWLLLAALFLFMADTVGSLWLQGALPFLSRAAPMGFLAVFLAALLASANAGAATDDDFSKYSGHIYFAWVKTGDAEQDRLSAQGLEAVCQKVSERTSARCEGAVGISPDDGGMSLFPLVYWPMTQGQPPLREDAARNLRAYMAHGGLLLVDTRDGQYGDGGQGGGLGEKTLRQVMQGVELPPLMTMPPDHVLTRSFYLLDDFPGRWTGREIWVERTVSSDYDNVPTLVIGGNDWAQAWGSASGLQGGERQREMALRFGVNLAMVAMTGSYKTDQVHMKDILERLGR